MSASRVARWNGTAWSALGTGVQGGSYALGVSTSGDVFIGGPFSAAGSVGSPYVVLYTPTTVDVEPETAPGAGLTLAVAPNPVAGGGTVRLTLPAAGRVRVAVYDALGREVAVLMDGERVAGELALALDASRLAPGVYAVRADAGGASAARRVTVAR